MRPLVIGGLIGSVVAAVFRRRLLALGRAGAGAASRAAGATTGAVASLADRRDLEELTKEELYERAQAADIPGRSSMSKDELIAALRERA